MKTLNHLTVLSAPYLFAGGTFAHAYIFPCEEAIQVLEGTPLETNAPIAHKVDQRCRVEIKKI
jgi:hypothetical protein